jgi:hypothetical protein
MDNTLKAFMIMIGSIMGFLLFMYIIFSMMKGGDKK